MAFIGFMNSAGVVGWCILLTGIAGLVLVGRAVWKSIVRPSPAPAVS